MKNRLFESVAKGFPIKTTGKTFFVSDATGTAWNDLNLRYPADVDGIARVYTSVTSALAQCTSGNGDVVYLAPDFTTSLTAAEQLSAETKGVAIIQAGKNIGDRWFAERLTANLPASVSHAIFTVTGKIRILSIQGTVTTIVQDQACTLTLSAFDSVLGTTNLAAAVSIRNMPTNSWVGITGTLASAAVTAGVAGAAQATPVIVDGSQIRIKTSATNSGKLRWRIEYVPVEPGARVFPA